MLVGTILTLIIVSFIPYKDGAASGGIYKPEITNGIICMLFFAIGLIRKCIREKSFSGAKKALFELDYFTVGLLAALFVVIGAITKAGIINRVGNAISGIGGGSDRESVFVIYTVIVFASVLLSAFIDNIPYTATMLPVVASIAAGLGAKGIEVSPQLFYYGLLSGATLGGNLTPIGASANITAIGILRKEKYEVKTSDFMKIGVPFTLAAVLTGYLLIWLIWAPAA